MKIYINDLVKGHSDVKVKCLTFGLYTQVSDSGPLGPLVYCFSEKKDLMVHVNPLVSEFIKCHNPIKMQQSGELLLKRIPGLAYVML